MLIETKDKTPYECDIEMIAKVWSKDDLSYAFGYIDAEHKYGILTQEQYNILYDKLMELVCWV